MRALLLALVGVLAVGCYETGSCEYPTAPCPPLPETVMRRDVRYGLVYSCDGEAPPQGAFPVTAGELERLLGPEFVLDHDCRLLPGAYGRMNLA